MSSVGAPGALRGPHWLATAMLVFLPLWLVGAGLNLYFGVTKASYSVRDEAPVFLVVFLVGEHSGRGSAKYPRRPRPGVGDASATSCGIETEQKLGLC